MQPTVGSYLPIVTIAPELGGVKLNLTSQPSTPVYELRLDVQRVSYNSTTQTLTWRTQVNISSDAPGSSVTEQYTLDLNGEILWSTNQVSRVITNLISGNELGSGSVSFLTPMRYQGTALAGFSIRQAFGSGVAISDLSAAVSESSISGSSASLVTSCQLSPNGPACDWRTVSLVGTDVEMNWLIAGPPAPPFSLIASAPTEVPFSVGPVLPATITCALRSFSMHARNPSSGNVKTLWFGVRDLADCGFSPMDNYNGVGIYNWKMSAHGSQTFENTYSLRGTSLF